MSDNEDMPFDELVKHINDKSKREENLKHRQDERETADEDKAKRRKRKRARREPPIETEAERKLRRYGTPEID